MFKALFTWRKLTRLAELSHFCPPSCLLKLARVYMALHAELLTRLTGDSFPHIILLSVARSLEQNSGKKHFSRFLVGEFDFCVSGSSPCRPIYFTVRYCQN